MQHIELTDTETDQIEDFIEEMWKFGKSTKMGDGSFEDFKYSYQRGKGAEVAVKQFLEQGGVDCSVDFEVYHGADDTDLRPLNIEVKQCPHYGEWVAIPESKFELIPDGHPIVQVRVHDSGRFEVCGWCYQEDLYLIEEGEKPFTQFEPNYCQRINDIRTDWSKLVEVASGGNQSYQRFTFSS